MPVRNCVWRQALRQTNSGSQQIPPSSRPQPNRPLSWLTLSLTARVGFPKRGSRTPPSRGGPGRTRRSCTISSGRPETLSFPSVPFRTKFVGGSATTLNGRPRPGSSSRVSWARCGDTSAGRTGTKRSSRWPSSSPARATPRVVRSPSGAPRPVVLPKSLNRSER